MKMVVSKRIGRRAWAELSLALATGTLACLTLLWPEWIELLFGVDPDRGSGALEWLVVAALAAISVGFAWRSLVNARMALRPRPAVEL